MAKDNVIIFTKDCLNKISYTISCYLIVTFDWFLTMSYKYDVKYSAINSGHNQFECVRKSDMILYFYCVHLILYSLFIFFMIV